MFGDGNSWDNDSAPPSAPLTLGIYGGADVTMTEQATTFAEGGNVPNAGTIAASLYQTLMGGNPTQHNAGVGGNGVGGVTVAAAMSTSETAAGQQQFTGRGSIVWSALTAALKTFWLAATMQEFSKKMLEWQADIGGESTKCAMFKTQAAEAANL